jgi:hypothetical protein
MRDSTRTEGAGTGGIEAPQALDLGLGKSLVIYCRTIVLALAAFCGHNWPPAPLSR